MHVVFDFSSRKHLCGVCLCQQKKTNVLVFFSSYFSATFPFLATVGPFQVDGLVGLLGILGIL